MKTANSITTEQFVAVEKLAVGEFVRRKEDAKKTYIRGGYCHVEKKYTLDDCDDVSRCIFVKKGTKLFVGFSY